MTSKSKRLASVHKIAIARERDAATELAKCKQVLEQQRQRLVELLSYQNDYQPQSSFADAERTNAGKLKDRQAFLAGLARAIAQQQHSVEAVRADYQERKRRWLVVRGKCQAIEKAIVRLQRQELDRVQQREQAEGDECAQRKSVDGSSKIGGI